MNGRSLHASICWYIIHCLHNCCTGPLKFTVGLSVSVIMLSSEIEVINVSVTIVYIHVSLMYKLKSTAWHATDSNVHHLSFIKMLTNATIIQIRKIKIEIYKTNTNAVVKLFWFGIVSVAVFVGCSYDVVILLDRSTVFVISDLLQWGRRLRLYDKSGRSGRNGCSTCSLLFMMRRNSRSSASSISWARRNGNSRHIGHAAWWCLNCFLSNHKICTTLLTVEHNHHHHAACPTWRLLPFLQECSVLVGSVFDDRRLTDQYWAERDGSNWTVRSQVWRGRPDGRFQSLYSFTLLSDRAPNYPRLTPRARSIVVERPLKNWHIGPLFGSY